MPSPAYIPWRSSVNQSLATGQLNSQNYEKAMAAGVSGELQQAYEETGRNADRAMRQQEITNQQSNVEAQQKIGAYQTGENALGAAGSMYVMHELANALTPATAATATQAETAAASTYTGMGSPAYTGGVEGVAGSVAGETAVGAETAEAASTAAESTSIWSTIGSYIGSAFEAIASFF